MLKDKGKAKISEDVKALIAFPVYIFICLPLFSFGLYLIFTEKKFPCGKSGACFIRMEEHPQLFYGASYTFAFLIAAITVFVMFKFLRALKRIIYKENIKKEDIKSCSIHQADEKMIAFSKRSLIIFLVGDVLLTILLGVFIYFGATHSSS